MPRQVFEVTYYLTRPLAEWYPKWDPTWPDTRDKPHIDLIEADHELDVRLGLAKRYNEELFARWKGMPNQHALEILKIEPKPDLPLYAPSSMTKLLAEGWETAGYIDVDAGLVMVGDPCYASYDPERRDGDDAKGPRHRHYIHNWSKFCGLISGDSPTDYSYHAEVPHIDHKTGEPTHTGAGVVVHSGLGDGTYPVLIRRAVIPGCGMRVVELRVLFDHTDDEDAESAD